MFEGMPAGCAPVRGALLRFRPFDGTLLTTDDRSDDISRLSPRRAETYAGGGRQRWLGYQQGLRTTRPETVTRDRPTSAGTGGIGLGDVAPAAGGAERPSDPTALGGTGAGGKQTSTTPAEFVFVSVVDGVACWASAVAPACAVQKSNPSIAIRKIIRIVL